MRNAEIIVIEPNLLCLLLLLEFTIDRFLATKYNIANSYMFLRGRNTPLTSVEEEEVHTSAVSRSLVTAITFGDTIVVNGSVVLNINAEIY